MDQPTNLEAEKVIAEKRRQHIRRQAARKVITEKRCQYLQLVKQNAEQYPPSAQ